MNDSVKDVFTVIEQTGDAKNIWLRIGAAFINRDQSMTIALNALPTNGRLIVKERLKPKGE